MRNIQKHLIYLPLMIVLGSCSFLSAPKDIKSRTLNLTRTPQGWSSISPGASDYAYSHPQSASIITVNSLCEKYEATSLRHLSDNILGGIESIQIEKREAVNFVAREALRTLAIGKIDGVDIFLALQVARKHDCIYDFILISTSQQNRQNDLIEFEKMLQGIVIP